MTPSTILVFARECQCAARVGRVSRLLRLLIRLKNQGPVGRARGVSARACKAHLTVIWESVPRYIEKDSSSWVEPLRKCQAAQCRHIDADRPGSFSPGRNISEQRSSVRGGRRSDVVGFSEGSFSARHQLLHPAGARRNQVVPGDCVEQLSQVHHVERTGRIKRLLPGAMPEGITRPPALGRKLPDVTIAEEAPLR